MKTSAICLALLLGSSYPATLSAKGPQKLKILKFEVFSEQLDLEVRSIIPPGGMIPYRVGSSCYGWRISFAPVDADMVMTEELKLPAAAREWGTVDDTRVRKNRSSAVTTFDVDGRNGGATRMWCVAQGDPQGEHIFTIRYRGRKIGQGRFRLGETI